MTLRGLLLAAAAAIVALPCAGASAAGAMLAIVIDDLGNRRQEGLAAVELPGPVTYAVLPHTPHGAGLARLAHALDKEVLVHLPMEATSGRALGPGGLTGDLSQARFEARVRAALASVPHARGANNHMGSRLTAMSRPMTWLMELLAARRDFLFLDSRTTDRTVAESTARASGVDTTWRDVFLDNVPRERAVRERLREAVAVARRNGAAVAIGHPYPATLHVLARELPDLAAHGVTLVPLSAVVAHRAEPTPAEHAPVRIAQSLSGQAAATSTTPTAPSTQVSSGAPASITGWNPSSP